MECDLLKWKKAVFVMLLEMSLGQMGNVYECMTQLLAVKVIKIVSDYFFNVNI